MMTKIVMLLSNGYRPDPRVQKEADHLSAAGFDITIISWDRQREYPREEVSPAGYRILRIQDVPSVYGIGAKQLRKLRLFWLRALSSIKSIQPDLIHCHDFDTLPAGIFWGKTHGIPVIYDAHEYYAELARPRLHGFTGNIIYQGIKVGEQVFARMADGVITVDETLAGIYRRLNKKVLVVGHYPSVKTAQVPSTVFTNAQVTLLYQGRLSVDRGLLIYAKILRILREKGVPAKLVLIGSFTPAEDETTFWQAIGDQQSAVDYRGWVPFDDMPETLRSTDVGLSILLPEPRYVAALPMKLFEYMAAGLPVIASDYPLVREVIESSQCGILVDPLSKPEQIADQIMDWCENPEKVRVMGENGRKAILDRYNWESLMGNLIDLYQSLTSK